MKTFVWISAGLMLIELLSFSSISLAEEGKWIKKADMPTARSSLSTSVVNGEIYAIGGTIVIRGNSKTVSKVEVYNPAANRWTEQTDMPTPKGWLSTSAVKGKIYAIGGSSKAPPERIAELSTVEEFDTGFRAVEAKDKLPTSWGKMKK